MANTASGIIGSWIATRSPACTPSSVSALAALQTSRLQVGVGDGAAVARLALPVDRHLLAVPGLDVPVDAVVGDVELAADEPLGVRRRPSPAPGPTSGASAAGRPARPRSLPVGVGPVVPVLGRVGLRGELLARREGAVLVGQVAERGASDSAIRALPGPRRHDPCCGAGSAHRSGPDASAPTGRFAPSVRAGVRRSDLTVLAASSGCRRPRRRSAGSAARAARGGRRGGPGPRRGGRGAQPPGEPAGLAGDRGRGEPAGGPRVRRAGRGAARGRATRCADPVLAGAVRVAEESGPAAGHLAQRAAAGAGPAARAGRGRPGAGRASTAPSWAGRGRTGRWRSGWGCWPIWSPAGPRCRRRCWSRWCTASCWRWPRSTTANGVVARAAARLTAVATGLDPKGLAVPEVGHLRHAARVPAAAAGFAAGRPTAIAAWLRHCCAQWEAGAREGVSIADARRDARTYETGGVPARGRRPTTREHRDPGVHYVSCCGLGVRRPGTQAHDDMPPAACCAWSARPSRTEPDRGGRVLLCRTAPGRSESVCLFVVRDRSHSKASGVGAPVQARRVSINRGKRHQSGRSTPASATEAVPAGAQQDGGRRTRHGRRGGAMRAGTGSRSATGCDEGQHRPAALRGHPPQRPVRVDHGGMPDGLQQRQIGDRVGVGPAVGQPVAALGGQISRAACGLGLAVAVVLDHPVVAAVGRRPSGWPGSCPRRPAPRSARPPPARTRTAPRPRPPCARCSAISSVASA